MANLVGSGDYRYEVIEDWAKLPDGWNAPMAAVAIDSQDRVYGFNRGEHRVIVFDRDGNFLSSWGEGKFPFPTPSTPTPMTTSGSSSATTAR